jgi:hypothetical protein
VVDGLKTSAYLPDTVKEHIEGKIGIDEAHTKLLGNVYTHIGLNDATEELKKAGRTGNCP